MQKRGLVAIAAVSAAVLGMGVASTNADEPAPGDVQPQIIGGHAPTQD